MRLPIVAVIGASRPSAQETLLAREIGERLARAGFSVLTGGLGGVMEAAAEGASGSGGLVLGILPGADPALANPHVTIAIPTGVGDARNAIIANTADGFIAVGGGLGTLSEIAFALKRGKPVVALKTWKLDERRLEGVVWLKADNAERAVALLVQQLPQPGAPGRREG
jgi:uncharacterized protein (TIGR00725 family)